jgi:hypothetical protein
MNSPQARRDMMVRRTVVGLLIAVAYTCGRSGHGPAHHDRNGATMASAETL